MEGTYENHGRPSDSYEAHLADDAWTNEGGNVEAGDPARPRAHEHVTIRDTPQAA